MKLTDNIYGHPIHYPNSEHIRPPVQKPRKRVVEPATRTEISADAVKKWHEDLERAKEKREESISPWHV